MKRDVLDSPSSTFETRNEHLNSDQSHPRSWAGGPSLQNSDLCCKCAAVDRFDDVKAVIVWSQKAL